VRDVYSARERNARKNQNPARRGDGEEKAQTDGRMELRARQELQEVVHA